MNRVCWFLGLFSSVLWAEHYRDPFQPPSVVPCVHAAISPKDWQLKGIIGTPDRRYGWIVTPQGQWLGLLPQQRLLDGDWRVVQILPRQLELRAEERDNACSRTTDNLILTLGNKTRERP